MKLRLFTCFLLLFTSLVFATEPANLSIHKLALEKYHDSGGYEKDISKVVQHAMMYMRFRLNQNTQSSHPKKLAMVLDIDETALSNYPDMEYLNFGGNLREIKLLESKGDDPAITYTRALYSYATQHGIEVFFITGREETMREATAKNLEAAGYHHWKKLYMRPPTYHNTSIVPYKAALRQQIEKQGYDVIINMGDQNSDIAGGYADMTFKLPNPFYLIS